MKKIIAVTLCAMMLLSGFAVSASAANDVITTWEKLSEKHGLPYFTVYPTGKTPTIDAKIDADEYTTEIDMMPSDNSIYITKGRDLLPSDKLPEYVKCYISVDADYIYFALDMQIDEKGNFGNSSANAQSDVRITMDMTSNKEIEAVYAHAPSNGTKYKNWNLQLTETPLTPNDSGYHAPWNGVPAMGWYNGEQPTKELFETINGKFYGDNVDVNKNHLVYEVKINKDVAKEEWHISGDKIEYVHFGLWSYYLAGQAARIGWGWEISSDVSIATDFVLPANNATYDLDDHIICVRLLDEKPGATSATTTEATTTAATTTAATTAATTTAAKTTTAATTTTASHTAGTTTAASGDDDKGCKGALAISAIALLPALGVACVFSKKKED